MGESSNTSIPARRQSIADVFRESAKQGGIALMPFVPAGYPDLATTAAVLLELPAAGASLIEVGVPFSDPVADGPVIQEAFSHALANKVRVADVLAMIRSVRPKINIPLVAMLSYSIVFRYGLDRFLTDARSSGFDGLILPDLPPPEAQAVCGKIRAAGLDTVLLIAPTTAPERRRQISALSSGFIYYLSVSGVTGERTALPADLATNIREIRQLTDRPVCVGFGISTAQHVAGLRGIADGAIVGSAIVRQMKNHLNEGPIGISKAVANYCRSLIS